MFKISISVSLKRNYDSNELFFKLEKKCNKPFKKFKDMVKGLVCNVEKFGKVL